MRVVLRMAETQKRPRLLSTVVDVFTQHPDRKRVDKHKKVTISRQKRVKHAMLFAVGQLTPCSGRSTSPTHQHQVPSIHVYKYSRDDFAGFDTFTTRLAGVLLLCQPNAKFQGNDLIIMRENNVIITIICQGLMDLYTLTKVVLQPCRRTVAIII